MATINAGASTAVTVAVGTYLEGTGAGSAIIGTAANVKPLTAGDAWQIGPFDRATVVSITAVSAITYEANDNMRDPSEADKFSLATTTAIQSLVSGAWSQYTAASKTDADATAAVLYTRTFQPGELIAGDALIVEGLISTPNSAATKRCKLVIGGVDYMTIDLTTSSTFHWRAKMRMRALASQIGWAVGSANGAYGSTGAAANVTSSIDFSAPVVVQFTAQFPVAVSGANSIVLETIDLERFRTAV